MKVKILVYARYMRVAKRHRCIECFLIYSTGSGILDCAADLIEFFIMARQTVIQTPPLQNTATRLTHATETKEMRF